MNVHASLFAMGKLGRLTTLIISKFLLDFYHHSIQNDSNRTAMSNHFVSVLIE